MNKVDERKFVNSSEGNQEKPGKDVSQEMERRVSQVSTEKFFCLGNLRRETLTSGQISKNHKQNQQESRVNAKHLEPGRLISEDPFCLIDEEFAQEEGSVSERVSRRNQQKQEDSKLQTSQRLGSMGAFPSSGGNQFLQVPVWKWQQPGYVPEPCLDDSTETAAAATANSSEESSQWKRHLEDLKDEGTDLLIFGQSRTSKPLRPSGSECKISDVERWLRESFNTPATGSSSKKSME